MIFDISVNAVATISIKVMTINVLRHICILGGINISSNAIFSVIVASSIRLMSIRSPLSLMSIYIRRMMNRYRRYRGDRNEVHGYCWVARSMHVSKIRIVNCIYSSLLCMQDFYVFHLFYAD